MFENLQDKLDVAFKNLKGQGKITDLNIATTVKEIRRALVDADVNYKIAKDFTDVIKDKALGQNVLTAVSPGQLMVKIVNDELTTLMGGSVVELNVKTIRQ
jgi:signal recognition particle subunit SRP54